MNNLRYTLGLDIGIGSVGWAVLQNDAHGEPMKIVDLGVRVFERAEQPKTGASLAAPRREARSARRRIRRRRHRKERIKQLIHDAGIMTRDEINILFQNSGFERSVYELRPYALDHLLTREELVRLLIHYAQRRGYKSNSTAEAAKDAREAGRVKAALSENKARMESGSYRTIGEMLWLDPEFRTTASDGSVILKVRNSADSYKLTQDRSEVVTEIRLVLEQQIAMGSAFVTTPFMEKYLAIFESQRNFDAGPGGNSPYGGAQIENMVGKCTFEPHEFRAAKASYTFEYFRLLQELNHLKLQRSGQPSESLTPQQREIIIAASMKSPGLTYAQIRSKLDLDSSVTFNALYYGSKTIAEQEKKKFGHMQAYHKMRQALDHVQKDAIQSLSIAERDAIGWILSVYKSDDNRRTALLEAGIPEAYIPALLELSFSKFGNLSCVAMQKLTPYLEKGETYDKAVLAVYGKSVLQYTKKSTLSLQDIEPITNPVVRRAVSQSIKVINAIVRKYGPPEAIRIELAREMNRNFDERNKLHKKQEENRANNERKREQIREYKQRSGLGDPTGLDIVKFKLYEEQDGICLYSGKNLDIERLFEPGYVDVDHIIPYSISFDDSYNNKVLVCSAENRQKGNRLPYAYMGNDAERWSQFETLVNTKIRSVKKKHNLLLKSLSDDQQKSFRQRNLVDTQYLSRVVYRLVADHLEFAESAGKRPVETVNGVITAQVRSRLGIDKIRENGDGHHAVDAAVIACITPGMVQKITRYAQQRERYYMTAGGYVDAETGELLSRKDYDEKYAPSFPAPWPQFRQELEARVSEDPSAAISRLNLATYDSDEELRPIFVSKMPNHKVTGAAHKETIRSAKVPGKTVTKTPLSKLKLDKNGEIAGYYNPNSDRLLYEALKARLMQFGGSGEKAFAEPFHKPKADGTPGPLVSKVKIVEPSTLNLSVNGGVAAHDSMVRLDVFRVEGEGYYVVPIYVADTKKKELPDRAVVAHKPYDQWKLMQEESFVFSLYAGDLIYIEGKKPMVLSAVKGHTGEQQIVRENGLFYYTGCDIAAGAIGITTHDRGYKIGGLGVKQLPLMVKYQVDVLGEYHPVKLPEKRMSF